MAGHKPKEKMMHGGKARKEMMGGGMYKKKQMKKGGRMVYGMGGEVMPQAKPN